MSGAAPPPPPPYTGYHHIVTDQVTLTRASPQVQVSPSPGPGQPPVMSPGQPATAASVAHPGVMRLSQQFEGKLSLSEDIRGHVDQATAADIYPKLLVQRSASQTGGHLDTELYPATLVQHRQPQPAAALEDIYPHLKMQRSASGGRLDTEIYPKILMQRSASQMSQPQRSVSQLSGLASDHEIYPSLLRQRGSTPLGGLEDAVYPRIMASNGKLIQVPVSSTPLSQQQLEEIYPKLLKQKLSSSSIQLSQLSQLPGAQLSTSVLAQQQQQQQQQLLQQQQLQQQQLQQQHQMQQKYLQAQYEEELPVYENVYENILVNNQNYNNQLDYVNLPPPPPYPGTNGETAGGGHVRNLSDTSGQSESSGGSLLSSHKSPGAGAGAGARLGWYESGDTDTSSDTLTQQPHLRPALLPHPLPAKPGAAATPSQPQKPLLPFSVTPPRPPGPSQAEMKVEALTKQLEEEMEKKEQQSEFFGACHACNEKVTGAGQACQV